MDTIQHVFKYITLNGHLPYDTNELNHDRNKPMVVCVNMHGKEKQSGHMIDYCFPVLK